VPCVTNAGCLVIITIVVGLAIIGLMSGSH